MGMCAMGNAGTWLYCMLYFVNNTFPKQQILNTFRQTKAHMGDLKMCPNISLKGIRQKRNTLTQATQFCSLLSVKLPVMEPCGIVSGAGTEEFIASSSRLLNIGCISFCTTWVKCHPFDWMLEICSSVKHFHMVKVQYFFLPRSFGLDIFRQQSNSDRMKHETSKMRFYCQVIRN